jgi:tetratricopeptide (TPR) repeat protein
MIDEHEAAIDDFSLVIKKNPKNAHAYFRRAFSLKALKRYNEAADDFEMAKALDPLNQKLVINYKKLSGINCIVL